MHSPQPASFHVQPQPAPVLWKPPAGIEIHLVGIGVSALRFDVDRTDPSSAKASRFSPADAETLSTPALNSPLADRLVTHLSSAIDQALMALPRHTTMGCVIGVSEARAGLPDDLHGRLIGTLDEQRPDSMINALLLPRGHASGLMAMQIAAQQIALGETTLCLAGGVDSRLDAPEVSRLTLGMHGAEVRPGEAAGACLLANAEALAHNAWPSLGRVIAAGTSRGPAGDEPAADDPIGVAVQALLDGIPEAASPVSLHLAGPGMAKPAWISALKPGSPSLSNPVNTWGDCGAACGPLMLHQALSAGQAAHRGGADGPAWFLLCARSSSGHATAVLIQSGA